MKLTPHSIILGSASPRRKELLSGLGLEFIVDARTGSDESYDPSAPHSEIPLQIAAAKSHSFHRPLQDGELLVTADTLVLCGDRIMGKPADKAMAADMLRHLSGRTHQVITGVCLRTTVKERLFSCSSDVTFKELSEEEIDYYIDTYRPFDKAGAYGIQEWIGYIGITSISGSYYNIMGLPVQRLYEELRRF